MSRRFAVLFCCLLGFVGVSVLGRSLADGPSWPDGTSQQAVKSFRITIGQNSLDEYVAQLKNFADKNMLAMHVGQSSPDSRDIIYEMWRADVNIIGSYLDQPGVYDFSFYAAKAKPLDPLVLDGLIKSLRDAIIKLQGASISEEKLE